MIEPGHSMIPVCRQCDLLDLSRASYYYEAREEDRYNLELMRLIDEQFTETPFYGIARMTAWLRKEGHGINGKRTRRLMRLMGLEAIYPKPRLSVSDQEHKKYPYLLRGLTIIRPDQVWSADITYIRLRHGFIYLVAVIDWYSRYVLSWEISTGLDKEFCMNALDLALKIALPEIFNTDQGVQFTSMDFTSRLESLGVRVSMDGRGRALDNVFVERLWRSVKYEEVYLNDYQDVRAARD
ncbi:MAG: IS3 family transposase, partial [Dissulfurimicrobium sp.]